MIHQTDYFKVQHQLRHQFLNLQRDFLVGQFQICPQRAMIPLNFEHSFDLNFSFTLNFQSRINCSLLTVTSVKRLVLINWLLQTIQSTFSRDFQIHYRPPFERQTIFKRISHSIQLMIAFLRNWVNFQILKFNFASFLGATNYQIPDLFLSTRSR